MSYIRILIHKERKVIPAAPGICTDKLQLIYFMKARGVYDDGKE